MLGWMEHIWLGGSYSKASEMLASSHSWDMAILVL